MSMNQSTDRQPSPGDDGEDLALVLAAAASSLPVSDAALSQRTISRRNIMRHALTLPFAAALATSARSDEGQPDDLLLMLCAQFDDALEEYEASLPAFDASADRFESCLAEIEASEPSLSRIDRDKIALQRSGHQLLQDLDDQLLAKVNDLARLVRETQASSVTGYGVKAHAAWWDMAHSLKDLGVKFADERDDLIRMFKGLESAAGVASGLWQRETLWEDLPLAERLPALAAPPSDAALLAIGEEFERLYAAEEAAKPSQDDGDWAPWEEAYNRTQPVAHRMIDMPAHSLAGLRFKAKAINWCHCGAFEGFEANETDHRLASGIVRDLLLMSTSIQPTTPKLVTPTQTLAAISAHRRALAAFQATVDEADEMHVSYLPVVGPARWAQASKRERSAFDLMLSAPARSAADRRAKIAYLLELIRMRVLDHLRDDQVGQLLQTLV